MTERFDHKGQRTTSDFEAARLFWIHSSLCETRQAFGENFRQQMTNKDFLNFATFWL